MDRDGPTEATIVITIVVVLLVAMIIVFCM